MGLSYTTRVVYAIKISVRKLAPQVTLTNVQALVRLLTYGNLFHGEDNDVNENLFSELSHGLDKEMKKFKETNSIDSIRQFLLNFEPKDAELLIYDCPSSYGEASPCVFDSWHGGEGTSSAIATEESLANSKRHATELAANLELTGDYEITLASFNSYT